MRHLFVALTLICLLAAPGWSMTCGTPADCAAFIAANTSGPVRSGRSMASQSVSFNGCVLVRQTELTATNCQGDDLPFLQTDNANLAAFMSAFARPAPAGEVSLSFRSDAVQTRRECPNCMTPVRQASSGTLTLMVANPGQAPAVAEAFKQLGRMCGARVLQPGGFSNNEFQAAPSQ